MKLRACRARLCDNRGTERFGFDQPLDFTRQFLFFFERKQVGILADKAFREYAARKLFEVVVFDCFQVTRRNFQFAGYLIQLETLAQTLTPQGLANGSHT